MTPCYRIYAQEKPAPRTRAGAEPVALPAGRLAEPVTPTVTVQATGSANYVVAARPSAVAIPAGPRAVSVGTKRSAKRVLAYPLVAKSKAKAAAIMVLPLAVATVS